MVNTFPPPSIKIFDPNKYFTLYDLPLAKYAINPFNDEDKVFLTAYRITFCIPIAFACICDFTLGHIIRMSVGQIYLYWKYNHSKKEIKEPIEQIKEEEKPLSPKKEENKDRWVDYVVGTIATVGTIIYKLFKPSNILDTNSVCPIETFNQCLNPNLRN